MGFIDYYGTKEDRYTEVLEFARMQQDEDWKRKEEQKIALWLQSLIGSSSYAQLNVEDLLKRVIIKYKSLQQTWQELLCQTRAGSGVNNDQLWDDFSLDLAARHLNTFPLNDEKKNRYLKTFQTKVFRIKGSLPADNHFKYMSENPSYRKYYAECFDPTWKGQHFFKWLWESVKKDKNKSELFGKFVDIDMELSLILSLYLFQIIMPHDDGWMHEAEAEQKGLADIRGRTHRNSMFDPNRKFLANPLSKNEHKLPKTDETTKEENGEELGNSVPDSGLNKMAFNELIKGGSIPNYIEAAKLLLECALPEGIAQTYSQLVDRMPVLQDAVNRFDDIYHADMEQFQEYYAPEALKITAIFLDYQAASPSKKILNETRDSVFLATRKLLLVVNEKIDEIYRFVTIDANAEAKALEALMSQDGHVDPEYSIK